jgi:predicted Rossmann fold flavoprotein
MKHEQPEITAVIGGGAAGICTAINLARRSIPVVILEKTDRIGKKILASGNGRCNLLNDSLEETHYNSSAQDLVKSIFSRYGKSSLLEFFTGLGLNVYSQSGRIFPITNQASSVLKVLEMELKRLSVPVEYGFSCSALSTSGNSVAISSGDGRKIVCRKAIIAGGGKSCPASGSDGNLYSVISNLGHTIVEPVPSGVPLVIQDKLCHFLQGQRISAGVKAVIGGKESETVSGELLFTKYGLSGTCILDISQTVSIAINRQKKNGVYLCVDMIPFMDRQQLKSELARRMKSGLAPEDVLAGILPNKLGMALKGLFEAKKDADFIVDNLKARTFKVSSTRGWNEAEFTSGGVNVGEVNIETLESKFVKNIYFAGEILDVVGERGGYNLGWAWASGLTAGSQS